MQYAGFWKRFGAYIIDAIIIGAANGVITTVVSNSIVTAITGIVISAGYFIYLESSEKQATVGKMVLGMKVVDMDGNRIAPEKAAIRYLGKILSAVILLIGYFMAGFTEKKQALHDILAKTLVVNAD